MPIVCIQRPNRSYVRHFTAADAARIWCYAKAAGATEETFLRLVRERHCWDLPDETSWREKVQDILDALEELLEAVADLLEPSKFKVLQWLYRRLPAFIREFLERKIIELIRKIRDIIDKTNKLPPPPQLPPP